MKFSRRYILVLLGVCISGFFLWRAFEGLDFAAIWVHIQQANPIWLLVGAVVYFAAVATISLRWQYLLRSMTNASLRQIIPLVSIGYMGNNVYPFRSGEILRIALLRRNHGIPFARATTTVVVERVFDGLVMLTFILVPLLFIDISSPVVRRVALVAAPLFLTALAVFLLLAARPNLLRRLVALVADRLPGKLGDVLRHLGEEVIGGLECLRSPSDLAGAVVASYLSWAIEASVYWIVSFAFDLNLSYAVMLLTVGVVNLAGLLPATPGQIGVYEFFVRTVLIAAGIDETRATAYALVVHAVIWLPVTLVGLYFLARQGLNLGSLTHARQLGGEAISS